MIPHQVGYNRCAKDHQYDPGQMMGDNEGQISPCNKSENHHLGLTSGGKGQKCFE